MPADIVLPPDASARAAFAIVLGQCLDHLAANARRAKASAPDALHQARVAVRRFDAAIRLFAGLAPASSVDHIKAELKWLRREMAVARELDVFFDECIAPLTSPAKPDAELLQLERLCLAQRKSAYLAAGRALRSVRFRHFLAFARASANEAHGDEPQQQAADQTVHELVSSALSSLRSKMKKAGKLEDLDASALHKLRLRAKRMRYTIDFSASLYPGRSRRQRAAAMLAKLAQLQSTLGTLNDADARRTILRRLMPPSGDGNRNEAGRRMMRAIRDKRSAHPGALRRKAARTCDDFRRIAPFWTD
jgi:triphosphatase